MAQGTTSYAPLKHYVNQRRAEMTWFLLVAEYDRDDQSLYRLLTPTHSIPSRPRSLFKYFHLEVFGCLLVQMWLHLSVGLVLALTSSLFNLGLAE